MLRSIAELRRAAGGKLLSRALWASAFVMSTLPMACLPQVAELTLDVTADATRISAADPLAITDQNTVVHSNVNGGSGEYSFIWSVKDPMGTIRNELLDDIHSGDPVFHAGPLVGPYLLTCTVTDGSLRLATDSTIIYVSQDLGLTLSVNRKEVPSGGGVNGQAEISAEIWGGSPPYAYNWSVVGPNGIPDTERLSGNANATRLFTSGYELGTYRITCKITDATGAFTSQTTEVVVNHLLSVNISSDRPIVTPGGGATGKSMLSADVSGGKAPYTYSWVVLGPDGIEGHWLDDPTLVQPTFTSPTQPGTYRASCTVTDARGETVVGSMLVLVDQQLSVSAITTRQRVSSDGGVYGQAMLKALPVGGSVPYTYLWTVFDPEGDDVSDQLNDATSATPIFTSTTDAGTYQFICQVTDAVGQIAVDSVEIVVGQQLAAEMSVTSSRSAAEGGAVDSNSEWVASGGGPNGQATISAEAIGGSPPYVYSWAIIGPDGQPAPDRLSGTAANTRFFHSSNEVGTYRVTCTITDATGVSYSDSVKIAVYSNLKLDVTMDRVQMPANGGPDGIAHFNSTLVGGTAPFTYAWTITGPDGLPDNARLDDPTLPNPTFTSGAVSGIYQAKCVVTDSVGQADEGSLLFMVGQPVTLDVISDKTDVIVAGGQAHLRADARGGIPPYQFSWTVTNPTGGAENERLDNTLVSNPTFTSALTTGTYSFTCTVTDSAGFVAILSTSLIVGGGLDQVLSISVTTDKQGLPGPGAQANLFAASLGAIEPTTYEWVVTNPSGSINGTALSDGTIPNPVFTAPATPGTYRVSCTINSLEKKFTDTVHIYVGMPLSVDVRTDKVGIPAAGGQASLNANVTGGVSPYTYAWTALNPTGASANAAISDLAVASPTFTAPATPGTYRFTCTVTDAAGTVAAHSLEIYVGMGLSLELTSAKQSLPSAQTTVFNAVGHGGISPYTYAWSVLNPTGADASAALSATNVSNPTFTAPATAGTYRVTCTVTDAANATFTQSMHIQVGMPLTLDVQTNKVTLPATGEVASLLAIVNGGSSPYTYSWSALNPTGASANAALSSLTIANPTFTAPATAGTYRLTCTATDGAGTTASASLEVYVGMGLAVNVTTAKQSLPSTQTTALNAAASGGLPAYTYAWTVLNPSGAAANGSLDNLTIAAPTFTAPAGAGTYRLTCTVTDSANATATQTIHLYVGMPLTADVRTDKLGLPATGGQAALTAIANGGVSPYTYAWAALNPTGASAAAALDSTTAAGVTFTAPATAGTYRFTCTITDAAGTTASASLAVYVGMNLSLDVSASKQSLPSTQTTVVTASAQGGIPAYSYAWSVLDPSGAAANATLSNLAIAAPTFTAPAGAGTYRATCTVTDSANETISRTIHILVGMPLSLDVLATKASIPAAGGTTVVTATANGGVAPYAFAWTATDPSAGNAAAALSATNTFNPTFTAPATAGTYKLTCVVTDAAGTTFRDSTSVYVGMNLSLDVTSVKQTLPSAQTTIVTASAQGGIAPYSYAWTALDPIGASANAALSNTAVAGPTFTAPAAAGTYRLTCTVTDGANETITDSLLIYVGSPLTADVRTNKVSIPATGGQATLIGIGNGGVTPYTFAWAALDPSNGNAAATLSATNVASPTFTAPATAGTYRFTCTITDGAGTTANASLEVYVGMNLSMNVTSIKQSLPSAQTTVITATAQGGISPYSYAWSVLDPGSASANAALSNLTVPGPTFTAPATAGTYRVTCTVTDAANETITRSIHIYVGMPLTADVRVDKLGIPATAGTSAVTGIANGGVAPYSFAWTALDPSGANASAALSATNVANPTFTAPATAGTYRLTCTITDGAGTTASASGEIYVGMGLSLNVTAVKQSLPSAQTTVLDAAAQGGIAPYSYAWTVLDPSNAAANGSLSNLAIAGPTFTAPATAGTYRVTCTVTDAANETIARSVLIYVGMPLTVDVRTNKLSIPATAGQATFTAIANGGTSGYTYAWTGLNPSGASATASLSNATIAGPTFTAPATAGTYRFTCTVTDTAGTTASASLEVYVGMGLSLDVTSAKQSLPVGQTTALNAAVNGGVSAYSYAWSVADPSGADASASLDDVAIATPTFTAPATAGTYRVTCTVTDSANETITRSIHLYVGMPLTLDVRTDKIIIQATGGTATLTAVPNGGVSAYTYAWTATDPTGADASGDLDDPAIAGPVFTAPATVGTYQFTCTVTDAEGNTAIQSLEIAVGTGLSASITTNKSSLPSGQTATLVALANGGTAAYSYAWTALDPSNASAAAALSATNVANPTFTAPATAGTYRFTCTVTDATNATFKASVQIQVGMPLTLDVRTDKATIPATGGTATLAAIVNGGVSAYTYSWTALNPTGGNAAATLTNAATASATFTAPATVGTYRFTCTVTDNAGTTAVQSVQIYVGMGLSLNVRATRQSLPSGQTSALTATAQGGISAYTYAWTALDPSNADASASLSNVAIATPTFTAPGTAGTYRLTCTVTDSANETVSQTLLIYVGMPLTVDVRTEKLSIPATGGTATLTATPNGGVSAYTYAWTALNPTGGSAAATLTNAATATATFTAPATAGTYRFTCTVTDSAGTTTAQSLEIYVGMRLSLNVRATKQSLPSSQASALTATAQGGISAYSYAWTALDPSGGNAAGALSATNVFNPTFTAPATAGTYRLTCTVTDSASETIAQTILINVGIALTVDAQADKMGIPATGGTATLRATPNGGVSPYAYSWTGTDPTGADATGDLDDSVIDTPTFTAPATVGTYRFTCMVTDAAGATAVQSLEIYVGMGLSLELTTAKQSLPSGQTAAFNATGHGGVSPYTYAWSVLDPADADASTALDATNVFNPTFTAPATVGTYRVTCTVTDAANAKFTQSMHIQVGMPLTLDVRTNKVTLPATGQTASLTAIVNGGLSPYTYAWSGLNPTGGSAAACLTNATTASATFTAPATVGTYRLTCTVTDAAGATASASLELYVGMSLAVNVTSTKQSLPSTKTADLNAAASGGLPAYTYAWSVLDPGGAAANGTLNNLAIAAPTFTAPAGAGTYRLTCTVTDSANATATQTIHLYVGMPLTADVRADKLGIPATGGTAALTAIANGGVSPYTYAWAALNPTGASAAAALDSTAAAGVTFTAPATAGTYRFTCTITDAAGTTASASLEVYVGMNLSLDVSADKQSLPSTKTTIVTASATGGIPAYTYAWSVLDPSGGNANATLNNLTIDAPTFTAPATTGTYRVTCTATDSASETVSTTIHILVGMPLSADVLATKASIPASGGTTVITATANGGVSPYSYAWTATDPSAGNAAASLSATNVPGPTFTAPATAGTYKFTCVVTDAAGTTFRDSTSVYVGMGLSLDITTVKENLPSAQTTVVTASAQGGISPYTYGWTALDPSGGNAAGALSATNVFNPTFTAPATAGTYRLTCTVTDGANETIKRSIHIYVGGPLSVDVATQFASIPAASGQSILSASVLGGVSAYSYAWSAIDQTGASANGAISSLTIPGPTFTAPAAGTYRISCTVTDSAGTTSSDTCVITVGLPLSAYLLTTDSSLVATKTAIFSATASGGTSPYSYAWTVLSPSSVNVTATVLSNPTVVSPTFTAPATNGTYRVTCTVTDNRSATATASLQVDVGMPLSADATSTKSNLVSAATATLAANASGGATPYSYAWTVRDSAGTSVPASLSSATAASPTFTAPATAGSYRATCVVTDNDGQTFTDTVQIVVGMPLSVAVAVDKSTLTATSTAILAAVPNGGISPYTYSWIVYNPLGADVTATTLNNATAQMPVFTAPVTGGTYRVGCTVTDAAGATFIGNVHIYVATNMITLTNPVAADAAGNPDSIYPLTTIPSQYSVLVVNTDLQYARNLQVRVTDAGNSLLNSFYIVVDGVSADGHFQTEFFSFTPPGGGGLTVVGTKAFSRVDLIRWVRNGAGTNTPSGDERVSIGVGNMFGLPEILPSSASVRQVVLLGTGALSGVHWNFSTTPGQQGVNFINGATQPNGSRDYEIYYDDN